MKERSTQGRPRHDFQRKDNLLYEVRLRNDEAGRSLYALGENAEDDHSGKKNDCEVEFAIGCSSGPSGCEYNRKDKRVDNQH